MKNFKSYAGKSTRKNTAKPHKQFVNSRAQRYDDNIHSSGWTEVSIIIRDRWVICQYLECEEPATSVHHIQSGFHHSELFFKEFNLIPLCEKHHRIADKQGIFEQMQMVDYWKKKVDTNRETGKKD